MSRSWSNRKLNGFSWSARAKCAQKNFTFQPALATLTARSATLTKQPLAMNWYYAEGDQQRGPVSENDLDNLFKTGVVQADTLVWREGMAGWEPYARTRPAATG